MTSTANLFALGALVLYGGWAVLAGVATRSLSPMNAVLLSNAASLTVVGSFALASRQPLSGSRLDVALVAS